jgi:DTW domain-containing protein YfiP
MRLVVLDCKWARRSIRLHPSIARLPRVHLDDPPAESYYWRWHNSGEGMLSTVEAVYYAAWQVGAELRWQQDRLEDLAALFWLFRHQRDAIRNWYEHGDGRYHPAPLPFTEAGKEFNRTKHKCRSSDTSE